MTRGIMRICIAAETNDICRMMSDTIKDISENTTIEIWDDPTALFHRASYSDWDYVIIETADEDEAVRLSERVSELSPQTGIMVIADDDRRAYEALQAHVQSYLVKPVSADQISKEYRYYVERRKALEKESERHNNKTLSICRKKGGDCLVDGVPVRFHRNKTRDLINHLAKNSGTMVSDKELLMTLWGKDDESTKSYLRSIKAEMVNLFKETGNDDAIVKQRGRIGILMDRLQ
jgi:two-component SAPR family response regulator